MRNFAYMKRSIDIDGVNVSYLVEGNGPLPVIVMHGWGCKADTVHDDNRPRSVALH